jgi:prepilin-type N-terminal cleavage/methylation domain-containing protein
MTRVSKNKLSFIGFTLVELLVVMSIVSFLAVIVMVSIKSAREKA